MYILDQFPSVFIAGVHEIRRQAWGLGIPPSMMHVFGPAVRQHNLTACGTISAMKRGFQV